MLQISTTRSTTASSACGARLLRRLARRRAHRAPLAISRTARVRAFVHPARRDDRNQHRVKSLASNAKAEPIRAKGLRAVPPVHLESTVAELPHLAPCVLLALSAVELPRLAQSACQESTMTSTEQRRANLAVPDTMPVPRAHEPANLAVSDASHGARVRRSAMTARQARTLRA